MSASTAVSTVLGVSADETKGKSFYECIQENCLPQAIRCLEGAKANDSIAYMRFWFRDPRRRSSTAMDVQSSDEDEDGGVHLTEPMDATESGRGAAQQPLSLDSRSSSGHSTDLENGSAGQIFGERRPMASTNSSLSTSDDELRASPPRAHGAPIEVEAVISCTSDGLVVILRRARPIVVSSDVSTPPPIYANGLFASPWAAPPIMPPAEQMYDLQGPFFPGAARAAAHAPTPAYAGHVGSTGPPMDDARFPSSKVFMRVLLW